MFVPRPVLVSVLVPSALSLCPPPGAILPPPSFEHKTFNFSIPDALFTNSTSVQAQNTSFATQASIGNTTVFQYEHLAPSREVNQSLFDTKIRIASATKLITALALELSKGKINLDDPITKFIPKLNNEFYGNVTIGSLADHTSGLGRFGYTTDLGFSPAIAAALGLPMVNNTLPGCDPIPGGRVCTHQEVLAEFNNPAYVPYSPESRAMYSNIGYMLLGKALEAVYNQSYEDVLQTLILDPVGMPSSTFVVPEDDGSAILPRRPEDKRWFVADFANLNPTGGLLSTPNDMLETLHALKNGELQDRVDLRRWMQPSAFLRSMHQYVGVAWAIFRITDLLLDFPRSIDIYAKADGVPGYGSYLALIPEYDITITINAAGGETSYTCIDLLDTITTALVPYADQLARSQASSKYAGTYMLSTLTGNDTLVVSSTSGPGLSIDLLTINNVSVIAALAKRQNAPSKNFSARLYPTDPDSLNTDSENWRMLLDQVTPAKKLWAELECMSWNLGDFARYVSEPLETFVFHMDADREKVASVELLGWRVNLVKVD